VSHSTTVKSYLAVRKDDCCRTAKVLWIVKSKSRDHQTILGLVQLSLAGNIAVGSCHVFYSQTLSPCHRHCSDGEPIFLQAAMLTTAQQIGPDFTRPKHKRTVTGFGAQDIKNFENAIPEGQREAWRKHSAKGFTTKEEFEDEAVRHIETTLARSLFNCDELAAYAGASLVSCSALPKSRYTAS